MGLSAAALTLAATLSPLANGASRIFWGWASDRLGRENTMIVAFVLQAICLCLVVARSASFRGWFASRWCWSTSHGGDLLAVPVDVRRLLRHRHATSNYAVLYTAKGVASIIGGWFGALLYERSGSWAMGFYGSAVMALVAAGIALRASRRFGVGQS